MTGIELAVGYLFAWAVRRARPVAERATEEVDQALAAGMDRLHDVVAARLGPDPALQRVAEEAGSGLEEPTERTRRRLTDSLEDAAERDPEFAAALAEAVAGVRAAEGTGDAGRAVGGNTFNGPTAFQVGDHNTQTNTFGS